MEKDVYIKPDGSFLLILHALEERNFLSDTYEWFLNYEDAQIKLDTVKSESLVFSSRTIIKFMDYYEIPYFPFEIKVKVNGIDHGSVLVSPDLTDILDINKIDTLSFYNNEGTVIQQCYIPQEESR